MHSQAIRQFQASLLDSLQKKGWHGRLGVSVECLAKIQVLAIRRLIDKDGKDRSRMTGLPIGSPLSFRIRIVTSLCWLTFKLWIAFVLLRIRYRRFPSSMDILDRSELVFLGDPARSFSGFVMLMKEYPGVSSFVSVFSPIDLRHTIEPETQVPVVYLSSPRLDFQTIRKTIHFLFRMVPSSLSGSTVLPRFGNNELLYFYLHFIRNIWNMPAAGKIAGKINKNAVVICRDDAVYAVFIEALNRRGVATAHMIHGTSIRAETSTSPALTGNIITGGEREQVILAEENRGVKVYPFAAPMQVIERNNIIASGVKPRFPIVILGSFDLWIIMDHYLRIFSDCPEVFKANRTLLRHHPSAPAEKRRALEAVIPGVEVSAGRTLVDDISDGDIIICGSTDSLQTCLVNFRKVIFFPPTDGDTHFYAGTFSGVLPNLLVAGTGQELADAVKRLQSPLPEIDPELYQQQLLYLFGTIDKSEASKAFNGIIRRIQQAPITLA